MKKILHISFILITCITYAQVGIGTTNPQADLHIGGDLLVQDNFEVGGYETVSATDENFKLITRTTNSTPVGQVKVLDVDALTVAPVNVIPYEFTNISLDNLTDLDLQYDANKYVVGVADFRYVGDAIKKVDANGTKSIGNFVVNTFESNGTWHLEIKNRSLDLNVGDTLSYFITLVVYDKSYYRQLPTIITNLGGSQNGDASSIPTLE